ECRVFLCYGVYFFFSSRRRHTRLVSDWSSDVCSSDLVDIKSSEITDEFLYHNRRQFMKTGVFALAGAAASAVLPTAVKGASAEQIGRASCRERGENEGGGG